MRILKIILLIGLALGVATHAQVPITGTIDSTTPFIEFPITVTNDGDAVTVGAQATSGNLDTLLYLVDENSAIVAENDDRTTDDSNSLLTYLQAPAGDYTVVITRFGVAEGDTTGDFDLTIEVAPKPNTDALVYDVSDKALKDAGYPVMAPKEQANWVILAYFGGDTNLEPGVMNDFNEFELAGGSNAQVRIVALMDRHPQFVTTSGNWRSARLFEVAADVSADEKLVFPPTLDTPPLADLGSVDTGSGETLAQFLVWAIKTYPAKHYAIALASHGGAWQGIVTDDTNGNTILTLPELREAFAIAKQTANVERFDLLINDACLMSSVEYQSTLQDDFTLSIASPEIVVDPALNMTLFTEQVNNNPNLSLKTLGRTLIDRYIADTTVNSERLDSAYLTFALTDMAKFPTVDDAIEHFATVINDNPLTYSNILGLARANTYTYSGFTGEDSQIDVGDFMRQMRKVTTQPIVLQAAQDVLDALSQALVYGSAAERVQERVTFYNIYFPQDGKAFKESYVAVSPLKQWARMLREYYTLSAPRLWRLDDSPLTYHPPIAPSVRVTRVYPAESSVISPPTINVEIVGRRIAKGSFTIDQLQADGTTVRLAQTSIVTAVQKDNQVDFVNAWKSGVDQSVFQWLPFTLPVISDGVTTRTELMSLRGSVATLRGRYREPNSDTWFDVSVLFNPDGSVANVISESRTGAVADVTIAPNADFQTYRYVVAPDGSTKPVLGTLYNWGKNGVRWSQQPTQDGAYDLGFLVQAFGGAVGFDSVTIKVKNYAEITDMRGYTDVNLGINFQIGKDWTPIVDYGNWLHSNNPDNTLALNVYYFDAEENIYDIADAVQQRFNLEQRGERLSLSYGGNNGLYFDYTYRYLDGSMWRGRAIVFYHKTIQGGKAVVYALDAPLVKGAPDPTELFRPQLDTLVFINADDLFIEDISQWRYRLFNNLLPYPSLKSWDIYEGATTGSLWTRLNPPNGFNGQTFAAVAEIAGDDSAVALNDLFAQIVPDAVNSRERFYAGDVHTWDTIAYTAIRRIKNEVGRVVDVEITGRIYVTKIYDTLYAWWFEMPTEQATDLLRNVFEPMIDGFAPNVALDSDTSKTVFLKAITLAESEDCANLAWNVLCFGGGDGIQVDSADTNLPPFEKAGDQVAVNTLDSIRVNANNPYNLAILNLQGNLPDRNTGERMRLYAFGGATVVNNAVQVAGVPTHLQILNVHDSAIAIREMPETSSDMVGSLDVATFADAIAQSEDGKWLRVRIPLDEGVTGWVLAEFVAPTDPAVDVTTLPIGTPEQPPFYPFQSITVSFDANANVLHGIIIAVPETQESLYIDINGTLFNIIGGSFVVWSEATNSFESVSTATTADVFDPSQDARRPEAFIPTPTQIAPERVPLTATAQPSTPVPNGGS